MPALGLGTWQSSAQDVRDAVEVAIDVGYRHIDCAYMYKNEDTIGDAIQSKIKDGTIRREDLFVTSKLWLTQFRRVRESLLESLKMLKLDYLDLYLVHLPLGFQYVSNDDMFPVDEKGNALYDDGIHYIEVYQELEKLKKEGLVKSIGVSNFNEFQLSKLLAECEIQPAVHQYEMHPYLDQEKLLQYCKMKEISVTGYSPFGSPGNPWPSSDDPPSLLERQDLKKMAEKYGKSVAQVLLRYILQRGVAVIPKSANPERIKSNAEIFDFRVTDEDMAAIKKLDCNWRVIDLPIFHGHKYYPFTENYTE